MLHTQPYRLFFPLGALLGGIGVAHWALYALDMQESYSGQVHALIQSQSFLMAFACGFLMTMVPRRTQTSPATTLELTLPALGLIAATYGPLRGQWTIAEAGFLLTIGSMISFALRRMSQGSAGRRPPDSFVLIPIGLLHGVVGGVLILASAHGADAVWVVAVGRGCLQEGMFLCLTLGIGHMVLPLLTGYDLPEDADASAHSRRTRILYVATGLLVLLSFPLQAFFQARGDGLLALRVGYGIRFAVAVYHIVFRMRAHRPPATPGIQRWFVWLSFWCVLVGLGLVLVFPIYKVAMLHVLFIGGFGLMTFSVSCHVILAHGDFPELVAGRPWPIVVFGILSFLAMSTRVSADFISSYWLHIGLAAGIWLVALLCWMVFLIPKTLRRQTPP